MAAPDYSGITKGIQGQFDYARQKAAQTEGANLQGQKDALARRAAQLGGGPSGAFVKAEQTAGNESAQRLQQANEGINSQQSAALRDVNMTQLGQQYQTSEREAGQGFQAGQQQSAQAFQGAQQDKSLAAQAVMQEKGITAQSSLQDKSLAAQAIMQKTGLDAQAAMQAAGFTQQEKLQTNTQDWQKANVVDPMAAQNKFENDQNIKTNAFNAMQALVAANYNGADIKKLISAAFPNFDISQLGDIDRVTVNGAGQGAKPAAVAPKQAPGTYTPSSTPTYSGNTQDPYYNPGGN